MILAVFHWVIAGVVVPQTVGSKERYVLINI